MIQVDLERSALEKVEDEKNQISKADFVKLGQDMKLLDFGGALGEKRKPQSPRVERRRRESKDVETPRSERKRINSLCLLCCCVVDQEKLTSLDNEDWNRLDRVEKAFKIWDTDQDGFLSWEEFRQVRCLAYRSRAKVLYMIGLQYDIKYFQITFKLV